MAKVILINLSNFSHNVMEISLENKLLPVATPILTSLTGLIKDNNFVVISKGILGGRNGVGLSDAMISAVSPQSGGLIESKIQGKLANSIYSMGVDAIVLINKAKSLTGIEITNHKFLEFNFLSAKKLTGLSVWQTTDQVKYENTLSTLAIGNSGENESLSASVVCDYGFATSQGGIGAVFGKMNLKYLSLVGIPNEYISTGIRDITQKYSLGIESNPLTKSEYEVPGFGLWANSSLTGYMAGNNFGINLPEVVKEFDPKAFIPYLKDDGKNSCPSCPQQCLKSYLISDSPIDGGRQHQLSITALLSQYGENDVEKLIEFNSYCHEIGVEHIYINALLIQEQVKSDKPIKKMIDGVVIKKLSSGFNQIKGMALPPWDPRGNQGLYLAMALNPSGPRYDVIEHDIDFDPSWTWQRHVEYGMEFGIPAGGIPLGTLDMNREQSISDLWLLWSALDSLGICIYAAPPTRELKSEDIISMIKSELDITVTLNDLYALGLLRLALQREMNHKLGLDSKADTLPEIFFKIPISQSDALLDGAVINRKKFESMKSAITSRLGWNVDSGVDKSTELWRLCEIEISNVDSRIKQLCE